jgi:uncharacterized protein YigE (DUF2233 family)
MKKYIVPLSIILTISVLIHFTSCTFDNEEDLLEDYVCDTTDISYNDLTYIFSDICARCHDDVYTYRNGIEMDNYESVKLSIQTGLVLPAIKHTGPYKMPNQEPKLSDCDILKIETWINAGMPEN